MKAIIAEKPSVAYEIARIVGATNRRDGYCQGNGFIVTWAFGHLVGLAMPEDYGVKGFLKESLPIIPQKLILICRKIKSGKTYIEDPGSKRQLDVISDVFNQCESIIVATDAGREGEVIFRYIYEYLNCKKRFERLWISSLTEKAIIDGLQNLKSGSDFDGLYYAGRERSHADWLMGINSTQALTVSLGDGLYSLGRVQTPTLALICKRYNEHTGFRIKNYFQIEIELQREGVTFKCQSVDKWDDTGKVEPARRTIEREGFITVIEVEKKADTIQAPLLFDLTGLQKEANKKLGLSAERTLEIAQSLYEKKFITYPRTGSKYITEDIWSEIPVLILALKTRSSCKDAVEKVKWERYNRHIVNSLKVTDHHGIMITENIPTQLQGAENAIYDMIAMRLLEAVSPSCHREITDVGLQVLHYDFRLRAIKIVSAGWKQINGNFDDEGDEPIMTLPNLGRGDRLQIENVGVLDKKTKPPALYTEAELLAAMEHAGNSIESKEERQVLKTIGIGTPATRAAVIETLIERNYVTRDKKALLPTDKGILVFSIVKEKMIADVAMTARWELAFEKIQNNEMDAGEFHREIEELTKKVTHELLEITRSPILQTELQCPLCRGKVQLREKVVKCADENCGWIIFRNVCGVQLSYKDIEALLTRNRTPLIRKMMRRDKKKFDAYIILGADGKTSFEAEQPKNRKSR